ncbi:MAG: DNA-binding protein [Gammaproteobacteria bacterium]
MTSTCPKCGYVRSERDAGVYPGTCPACGIAYIKWQQAQEAARLQAERAQHEAESERQAQQRADLAAATLADLPPIGTQSEPEAFHVPVDSFWRRVHHYTCFMPSDGHIAAFWAHVAVYLVFLLWGLNFLWHGVDALWIGRSMLHLVNLPFHEYGHVAFSPFGTFAMYLGGSLFQILLPLLPLAWFMARQRDNFAAAMMLWWCGQNFIDVAPYIADAQLRALPLIGGEENNHDWWNLLTLSGSLEYADFYANLCFTIGAGVMLLSNAWAAYLLSIEFRGRTLPQPPRVSA